MIFTIRTFWVICLIDILSFSLQAQKIEIEQWGPQDRKFKLELLVSYETIDATKLGGTRYISIDEHDFNTFISVIDSLEVPILTLDNLSGSPESGSYAIFIISKEGLKEFYLKDSTKSKEFFEVLGCLFKDIKAKSIFKTLN